LTRAAVLPKPWSGTIPLAVMLRVSRRRVLMMMREDSAKTALRTESTRVSKSCWVTFETPTSGVGYAGLDLLELS